MFRNFWRKSGDRSKAEVENSPPQSSSVDYEAVLFVLLDEVERRSEFNRGWIRGFLEQRGVAREALAEMVAWIWRTVAEWGRASGIRGTVVEVGAIG
ncbi:hypothetical protein [Leptolyngbya sp. GGD]|uniref:hypothetical protein n=1 Tax=Leptolyngbya sp. GGD TaxID=2997907 RepID=UPI00227ABC0C|nr:hypothetical protein [Leptolyngbya sp. GGD]MCY6491800.1 hypothetical protein [Leptolyngbya sp. GGD]